MKHSGAKIFILLLCLIIGAFLIIGPRALKTKQGSPSLSPSNSGNLSKLELWADAWKSNPPKYKKAPVISLFLIDPSGYAAWKIVDPTDAKLALKFMDSNQISSTPQHDQNVGFIVVTAEEKYYLYLSEPLTETNSNAFTTIENMKHQAVPTIDLFELLSDQQIVSIGYTGYRFNEKDQLIKYTFHNDHKETIGTVLSSLQKLYIKEMELSTPDIYTNTYFQPVTVDGSFHLILHLGSPYQDTDFVEICNTTQGLAIRMSIQGNTVRLYTVDPSIISQLLDTLHTLPEVQSEVVKESLWVELPQPEKVS